MPSFNSNFLEAVFANDAYNEDAFKNQYYRALMAQFKHACDKFAACLPDELKLGFSAIRDLTTAIELESRDVGKAIGLAIARDLFSLLLTPNEALEALTQTYNPPEQTYDTEFRGINTSIENYLKSRKGADT